MSKATRAAREMLPRRGVCVAYLYAAQVEGQFCDALVALVVHDATHSRHIPGNGGVIGAMGGPRVASTRNRVVRTFLDNPALGSWLWFVDSDMVFAPDALDRLLAFADPVARPVVAGLCFSGSWGTLKMAPTLVDLDGHLIEDWPRGEPIEVGRTGAACLLIHRSVLERMGKANADYPYPWFEDGHLQGLEVGEDVTFCLRLNAMGIPVWVHTGIRVGHVKPWVIDEAMYDAMRPGP